MSETDDKEQPSGQAPEESDSLKGAGLSSDSNQPELAKIGRDGFQPIHLSLEGNASQPENLGALSFPLLSAERVGDQGTQSFPLYPDQSIPAEPTPIFHSWSQPYIPAPTRHPNLGDLSLLSLFAFFALLGASLLTRSALYFHLFGITSAKKAITDIHYTLGSQVALYLLTFLACLLFFPLVWHKGFFAGLQWNGTTAFQQRKRLFGMATVCFVLALTNGILLPGPTDTPIDKIFRAPGAAWLLFGFGVTLAPFFEEILFRGFLLPTVCTAYDWIAEKATGEPAKALDPNGHPQWSITGMAVGSVLTSVPFALMHAEQTGHAIGPFLLLVCVSLVLCWARLSARSLAASVLVHAFYNLLLFALMLLGTGGFQHLDKM
jgi:membrane protease YdiL (CAAX protease family)